MKKLAKETIEQLALKMRLQAGLNPSEPIHTKTLLRKLGVMVIYRPLSEKACGLSMRSSDGRAKFILVNSNNSRGRQHFTICHELFHLYYDEEPKITTKSRNPTSVVRPEWRKILRKSMPIPLPPHCFCHRQACWSQYLRKRL